MELNVDELPRFKIRNDLPKNRIIVAYNINGVITNKIDDVIEAIADEKPMESISLLLAELMAALDLGVNWEKLAKAPPICGIDEDENLCLVEGGFMPKNNCIIEGCI
jgi:hypothetical protein